MIGRKEGRVENPDQYVYEVVGKPELPYVRLVHSGPLGRFNRAQRAINNSREYFAFLLVQSLLAGFVYPQAVFLLSAVYLYARHVYTKRYIEQRETRIPANVLSLLLGQEVLKGMVLLTGIQSFLEVRGCRA